MMTVLVVTATTCILTVFFVKVGWNEVFVAVLTFHFRMISITLLGSCTFIPPMKDWLMLGTDYKGMILLLFVNFISL